MTTSESKGRFFLQNESIRITNRIDSNRELECSNRQLSDSECHIRPAKVTQFQDAGVRVQQQVLRLNVTMTDTL